MSLQFCHEQQSRWSWRYHHHAKVWVRCGQCGHWVWEHSCHVAYDEAWCNHDRMEFLLHGRPDCQCRTTVTALGGIPGDRMEYRHPPNEQATCPDCGVSEPWQEFMRSHDERFAVTRAQPSMYDGSAL